MMNIKIKEEHKEHPSKIKLLPGFYFCNPGIDNMLILPLEYYLKISLVFNKQLSNYN